MRMSGEYQYRLVRAGNRKVVGEFGLVNQPDGGGVPRQVGRRGSAVGRAAEEIVESHERQLSIPYPDNLVAVDQQRDPRSVVRVARQLTHHPASVVPVSQDG